MSWEELARCRQLDPELFFAAGARSERKAKAVCGRCPVQDACLAFALDSRAEFGIWGGLSSKERQGMFGRSAIRFRVDDPLRRERAGASV